MEQGHDFFACWLNYSYVMNNLLSLLYGDLRYHITFLNAFYNCPDFDCEGKRYIQTTGTNYSTYISEMYNRKRNPTTDLQKFLIKGSFKGKTYSIPTAEGFKNIVSKDDKWLMPKENEDEFRDRMRKCIDYCLENYELKDYELQKLEELYNASWKQDIHTFVFNLVYAVILDTNNNDFRELKKSEETAMLLEALNRCDKLSADIILLHMADDEEI